MILHIINIIINNIIYFKTYKSISNKANKEQKYRAFFFRFKNATKFKTYKFVVNNAKRAYEDIICLLTFVKINSPFPKVVRAKSMLPPSVATFKKSSKSINLFSTVLFLAEGSSEINSSATAFWISKIAL